MDNTIFAGNGASNNNLIRTTYSDSGQVIVNASHSIFGDKESKVTGTNTANVFSNSPNLAPLNNNGGTTKTHLPNTGSPALDVGNNSFAPDTVDQRGNGFSRIYNGTVDIGAVERQAVNPIVANLTLVKTLNNNFGGSASLSDFTLTATGPSTINGTSGSANVTSVSVIPGNYVLSETTLPGYSQTSLQCTGASDTNLNDGLTLRNGEAVVCTFVNEDKPAMLTLTKQITNNEAGVATLDDFTLTAEGAFLTTISGISGSSAITNAAISAGNYLLYESSVEGYTQTSLTCLDGADFEPTSGLTLRNGEDVSCTFINDYRPAD